MVRSDADYVGYSAPVPCPSPAVFQFGFEGVGDEPVGRVNGHVAATGQVGVVAGALDVRGALRAGLVGAVLEFGLDGEGGLDGQPGEGGDELPDPLVEPGAGDGLADPSAMLDAMLLVAFEVVSQRPYNPDHALPVDDECATAQVEAVRRWRFGLAEEALDLGRCRVRDFECREMAHTVQPLNKGHPWSGGGARCLVRPAPGIPDPGDRACVRQSTGTSISARCFPGVHVL